MRRVEVTPEGDVKCPVCGAKNQFAIKRTAKAKWMAVPTIGVGLAAMPKRLRCNGCGTNLKTAGSPGPTPSERVAAAARPRRPRASDERGARN